MKKWMAFFLTLTLLAVLVGCGSKPQPGSSDTGVEASPSGEAKGGKKQLKIALLLPGPINDMGWNASAYEGLKQAEKKYGASVAYVENVAQSDMEENFRGFALQGYDLIIGHGFQFGDAAKKVASQFPKAKFVVTSSNISQPPNVASVNIDNEMQGFIMGAIAALMSKSKVVGNFNDINKAKEMALAMIAQGADNYNGQC
ncbi:BMP family protein [Thermanaeromonas toyohensis]|uniref:BMP family protein n=1 Tax=Thermanaeromonas toyohensis TaxID=161154 RepID=UPI0018D384C3|nr:BMP family protein [Thermanaeromonas toyohensis]